MVEAGLHLPEAAQIRVETTSNRVEANPKSVETSPSLVEPPKTRRSHLEPGRNRSIVGRNDRKFDRVVGLTLPFRLEALVNRLPKRRRKEPDRDESETGAIVSTGAVCRLNMRHANIVAPSIAELGACGGPEGLEKAEEWGRKRHRS